MNPALLLLTDSRLPAGGHAHSGGTEQAIARGAVHDLASLAAFLLGRLHTSGHVAAALAAAACTLSATHSPDTGTAPTSPGTTPVSGTVSAPAPVSVPGTVSVSSSGGSGSGSGVANARRAREASGRARPEAVGASWDLLDAEADARTASPAQRDASRTQGRLLLRVARRLWPSPTLDGLAQAVPNPHHPIALGAAAHAAGATPEDAALAAAYHSITGPATAAVRLLGLDPVAVHGLLADLAPDLAITATTAASATSATTDTSAASANMAARATEPSGTSGTALADQPWAELPARSAPALDLLAERHAGAKVRLFVS